MKNLVFLLLFALCTPTLLAQAELRGLVTYQNTGKRMEAIQVTARGASPTITKATTDGKGTFKLVFPNKQPGESVVLNIENRRYDLVNHVRELEVLLPASDEDKQVRLVVCNKGERDANAAKYYDIAVETFTKSYKRKIAEQDRKINVVENQLTEGKITQAEQTQQIAALNAEKALLQEQYKQLDRTAWKLAEDFSKVDLAQADEIYKKAFGLFQEGKIEQARKVLNSEERQRNLEQIAQSKAELEAEKVNIKSIEAAVEKQHIKMQTQTRKLRKAINKEIQNYILQADLAKLALDYQAVEKTYQEALKLDDTHIELLWDYAFFSSNQNNYKVAIKYFKRASFFVKNQELKATFLNNLGVLYYNQQDLQRATTYSELAMHFQKKSVQRDFYKNAPNLVNTLNSLGGIYSQKNQFRKSESYYLDALSLNERLVKKDSNFISDRGVLLANLGRLAFKINERQKAAKYFLEARAIIEKKDNEINASKLIEKARLYNDIGILEKSRHNFEDAEKYYVEALSIWEDLASKNLVAYAPNLVTALNGIGILYLEEYLFSKSQLHLEKAIEVSRTLYNKDKDAFTSLLASSLYNTGCMFSKKEDFNEAIIYYKEALKFREDLASKDSIAYWPIVADTYNAIGGSYIYLQNNPIAISYLQQSSDIWRKLASQNPNVYLPKLATALNNLGVSFHETSDLEKAKKYYEDVLSVYENLSDNNETYLPKKASTCRNLGDLYRDKEQLDSAYFFYQKALNIYKNTPFYLSDTGGLLVKQAGIYIKKQKFDIAEAKTRKALAIYKEIAPKRPVYWNDVCSTSLNLCYIYKEKTRSNMINSYRIKARDLLTNLESYLEAYSNNISKSDQYWNDYKIYKQHFD